MPQGNYIGFRLDLMTNVNDNLNEMWQRLDERYGKPSKLTNVRMNNNNVLDQKFKEIISTL